jgi:hypothetical protein
MQIRSLILIFSFALLSGCLDLEQEPIILVRPEATISAHIKDQKVFATALVNVNTEVLFVGNLPTRYTFSGELAIYDTDNGTIIDAIDFSGEGLSKVYTVSADTLGRDRFIAITSGTINAYADIGNDGSQGNDKLVSTGDFYEEATLVVNELLLK